MKKIKLTISSIIRTTAYFRGRLVSVYRTGNRFVRRFDYRRPTHLALAVLIFLSAAAPVLNKLLEVNHYAMSKPTKALLTEPNPALTAKIKLDEKGETYRFNHEEIAARTDRPGQQSQALGQGATDKTKVVYGFDAGKDIKKGVTITDSNSLLSFKLVPMLNAREGELVDGHIVYPIKGMPAKLIYTPEGYGIKEDLVLSKEIGDSLEFSYRLDLPGSIEAKMLPNGSIGLYTANPALFGNITFGSDNDRTKVENAREKADKDFLQFVIPAPVIKQSGSQDPAGQAVFDLKGNMLTVKTRLLSGLRYPISIDPSTFTTSGSNFGSGNNEGGLDTGNSLTRRMSGASIGSWGINSFTLPRYGHASVIATVGGNTYLYVLGGCTTQACSSSISNVSYAPINTTTGEVGSWTSSSNSFDVARWGLSSVSHNGYLYILGGCTAAFCTSERSDTQYIKINNDGSLSTPVTCTPPTGQSWCTTTSFSGGRHEHTSVIAGGGADTYVYVIGGCALMTSRTCNTTSGYLNDAQKAKINTDGSIGTWSGTSSIVGTGRFGHASAAYSAGGNNYVSLLGGRSNNDCGPAPQCSDFQFAQVNNDGTLGSWTQNNTNNMSTVRYGHTTAIYNGYVFAFGGCASASSPPCTNDTMLRTVESAPIGSDGNLSGNWSSKASFNGARHAHANAVYGDLVYVTGGNGNTVQCQGLTIDICDDVQYAKIDGSGNLISPGCANGSPVWCGNMNLPEGREGFASFTYTAPISGTTYVYVVGGSTTSNACQGGTSNLCNDVVYAPILSDGRLGSWQKLGSTFNIGRKYHGSLIYNGNIYVLGGETTSNACQGGTSNFCNDVQYAALNSVDGSIGAWATTENFTTGRRSFGLAAYNNHIYVVGGYNGADLSDIRYAKFSPDGTIGSWFNSANPLPAARSRFPAIAYNGYLYVVGGCMNLCTTTGTDYRNDILKTSLEDDGSNLGWVTACSDCYGSNRRKANAAATIYNGVIYVVGGHDETNTVHNDVRVSSIGADGSIDRFTAENTMIGERYGLGLFAHKSKLYTIGGCRTRTWPCAAHTSQVKFAAIDILGSTGTYTDGPVVPVTAPDVGIFDISSVVYNGVIYVTGGCTEDTNQNQGDDCLRNSNKVHRATIGADGSIGAWSTSDYTLLVVNAVSRHAAIAHNGYLYMIGGMTTNSTGGSYVSTVRYSQINSNGSLATNDFPSTTSLPGGIGRGYMEAAVYNNYMYIFGGCTDNHDFGSLIGECVSSTASVYSAPINADGTLGAWTKDWDAPDERMVNTSTLGYGLAVAGKYVYITAGQLSNKVWVSSFDGSGGLTGNFVEAGPDSNLPTGTKHQPTFAHNGNLYTGVGGPGGYGADMYTAPINFSNGTVGPWAQITSASSANFRGSGLAYRGKAYFMGGYSFGGTPPGTPIDNSKYATIYNGGSGHVSGSGSWSTTGTDLPNARSHHASVALDGYLYIIGGQTSGNACQGGTSNICNDVLKAPINNDGTLGIWTIDSTFTTARRDLSAAIYEAVSGEKYVYITGGCGVTAPNCSSLLSDVQFAHVKPDGSGSLENWAATTPFAAPPRFSHTTVIHKDFIYVIGGCSSTDGTGCIGAESGTQKARLSPDGTIPSSGADTWTPTTTLPAVRYAHSTTIYNGRIYIIGGRQTSFCQTNPDTVSCTQIYLGTINESDGTIPSWSITGHLQVPLYAHASVAANGYLYVIGGATISGVLQNSTYYASLHQDGSIGYWSKSLNLATATNYLSAVYSDGYLYAVGGTAASAKINYGGQQAPVRIGRYSILYKAPAVGNSLLDFCGGTNNEGFNFTGNIPSSSSLTLKYSLAGQVNKWRGPTLTQSGILPNIGHNLTGSGRALFATLLINDSKSATFPEDSSQQSNVTAVNFNYRHSHAQPPSRLRHGAFFNNEEKEVLDSNPVKPSPNANNFCSSI